VDRTPFATQTMGPIELNDGVLWPTLNETLTRALPFCSSEDAVTKITCVLRSSKTP
jgi:hypothetical protein